VGPVRSCGRGGWLAAAVSCRAAGPVGFLPRMTRRPGGCASFRDRSSNPTIPELRMGPWPAAFEFSAGSQPPRRSGREPSWRALFVNTSTPCARLLALEVRHSGCGGHRFPPRRPGALTSGNYSELRGFVLGIDDLRIRSDVPARTHRRSRLVSVATKSARKESSLPERRRRVACGGELSAAATGPGTAMPRAISDQWGARERCLAGEPFPEASHPPPAARSGSGHPPPATRYEAASRAPAADPIRARWRPNS
jgi:hypothetical protein